MPTSGGEGEESRVEDKRREKNRDGILERGEFVLSVTKKKAFLYPCCPTAAGLQTNGWCCNKSAITGRGRVASVALPCLFGCRSQAAAGCARSGSVQSKGGSSQTSLVLFRTVEKEAGCTFRLRRELD